MPDKTLGEAIREISAMVPPDHRPRLRFDARRRMVRGETRDLQPASEWIYDVSYHGPKLLRVDALTPASLVRRFAELIAPEIALICALDTILGKLPAGFNAEIWTFPTGGSRFALIVSRGRSSFVARADTLNELIDRFRAEFLPDLPAVEAEITSPHLPPPR